MRIFSKQTPHRPNGMKQTALSEALNQTENELLLARHPFLADYADFLGELSLGRMVGVGNNGIVVTHPQDASKVVKISNGERGSHDLDKEFEAHTRIMEIVRMGHGSGALPESARVPQIFPALRVKGKTVLVMEKVEGQSFMTVAYLNSIRNDNAKYGETKSHPNADELVLLRDMTDYRVADFLERNYGIGFDHFLKDWGAPVSAGIWAVNNELKLSKTAATGPNALSKLRGHLYENGVELTDSHGGNFMRGKDASVYAIDFGMTLVAREWKKTPFNVASNSKNRIEKRLSNLDYAPFVLHGRTYASIEGFWQGLKFPEGSEMRASVAAMSGLPSKKIGDSAEKSSTFEYLGQTYRVGSAEHQLLMKAALRAKFSQNPDCLQLLLATGNAEIIHEPVMKDGTPYPDSTTIPAAVFSRFLMEIRDELRKTPDAVVTETTAKTSNALEG